MKEKQMKDIESHIRKIVVKLDDPVDSLLIRYTLEQVQDVGEIAIENADFLVLKDSASTKDLVSVQVTETGLSFTFAGSLIKDVSLSPKEKVPVIIARCPVSYKYTGVFTKLCHQSLELHIHLVIQPKRYTLQIEDHKENREACLKQGKQMLPLTSLNLSFDYAPIKPVNIFACLCLTPQSGERAPKVSLKDAYNGAATRVRLSSEKIRFITALRNQNPRSRVSSISLVLPEYDSNVITHHFYIQSIQNLHPEAYTARLHIEVASGNRLDVFDREIPIDAITDTLFALPTSDQVLSTLCESDATKRLLKLQAPIKYSKFDEDIESQEIVTLKIAPFSIATKKTITDWHIGFTCDHPEALSIAMNEEIDYLDTRAKHIANSPFFAIEEPCEHDSDLLQLRIVLYCKVLKALDCDLSFSLKLYVSVDLPLGDNLIVDPVIQVEGSLVRSLSPYWLAIDFGTSVVISAFTNRSENFGLLPLNEQFKRYMSEVDKKNVEIVPEPSMIHSSLVYNAKGEVGTNSYWNAKYRIPPTPNELTDSQKPIIFNLKSFIGRTNFPDAIIDYMANSITLTGADTQIDTVPDVLGYAYRQLMANYLQPLIKVDGQKCMLNQAILSIPNSFTYNQIQVISNNAQKHLNLEEKNIHFISESDAAACYYYSLLRGEETQREHTYVLIYDIGAGTTDVTYFDLHKKENGTSEIRIIGKMGKACAGNYLDYVLAEILEDLYKDIIGPVIDSADNQQAYKTWIQNGLKPNLNTKPDWHFDPVPARLDVEKLRVMNTEQIVNHRKYKHFLAEATDNLVETFFNLYNPKTREGNAWNNGNKPSIDSVMLCGRSSQIHGLEDALQKALQKITGQTNGRTTIPMKIITNKSHIKEAVLRGSLIYALYFLTNESKDLSFTDESLDANYGVLFKKDLQTDRYSHIHVLYPGLEVKRMHKDEQCNLTIGEFENTVGADIGTALTLYVYKSYAAEPSLVVDKDHFNYTSIMYQYSCSSIRNKKQIKVTMKLDKQKRLSVRIDGTELTPKNANEHELTEFERKSAWPYISQRVRRLS